MRVDALDNNELVHGALATVRCQNSSMLTHAARRSTTFPQGSGRQPRNDKNACRRTGGFEIKITVQVLALSRGVPLLPAMIASPLRRSLVAPWHRAAVPVYSTEKTAMKLADPHG